MKALVVFHDHGCHPLARFLKAGFKHCFVVVAAGPYWVRLDGHGDQPVIDVVCASDFDLAMFYRQEGYTVVKTRQEIQPSLWPFVTANCVGLVSAVLCRRNLLVFTPYRLYRSIVRHGLLPGKSIFSPSKPKIPEPVPPPPPPERDDSAVIEAARQQREAELKRKGRRASFLTSGEGDLKTAPLGRPQAGSDQLGA